MFELFVTYWRLNWNRLDVEAQVGMSMKSEEEEGDGGENWRG